MKKHLVFTQLFDSGGSNAHLKVLINYFKKENTTLLLAGKDQLRYLENIEPEGGLKYRLLPDLHPYACLTYRLTTNIKEAAKIIWSLIRVVLVSLKHGFADITISAVAPEKHLYFFWIPFVRVTYILHTQPGKPLTPFTSFTCNYRLGKRKRIIAVSYSMQQLLFSNWSVGNKKQPYITVIHNTLLKDDITPKVPETGIKKTVITLGHVDENKNPATWLQVARALTAARHDVNFLWLGNGPDLEHFQKLTTGEENISFLGLIKNPHIYLAQAHIYYQPSLNESHGIAVLEAMYTSLPCVVARVGGLSESVSNHYNGILVNPVNIPQNADAITTLLDDAGKMALYGQNSYKRYHELFSYNIFKAKMDTIYLN